ncbi:MAG: hypothetical protein V2A57_01575 [Elusimicrobiota bacterium]
MLTKTEFLKTHREAIKYFSKAGIILTPAEKNSIEIADFGLGDLKNTGLEIFVYVNTSVVRHKSLVNSCKNVTIS